MTIFQLATEAGRQIAALGYEENLHKSVMGCRSAQDICRLWADFLIENRDESGFILRVHHAGNLPALVNWCRAAKDLLSVA